MAERSLGHRETSDLQRNYLQRILSLFRVEADDMALVRAQYAAFSKQIPLLYFILTTNTLAVAYTYSTVAPHWLAIYVPAFLCSICIMRCAWWWRTRNSQFADDVVLRYMRRTTRLAAFLTLGFTVWGIMMFQYGDAYAKAQVVFCMALTVIGCVFCLMHLRPAALSVTVFANTPFILYFFFEGHFTLRAIAINLALVSGAMIIILMVYNRDFRRLVASQAETRRLSDENFQIANLDSLTALPNRRSFFAALADLHRECEGGKTCFAIGIIDLDGFKPVNDTYGHATGDRLLVEVGQRLRDLRDAMARDPGFPRQQINVARLGGDEFAVLVSGNVTESGLKALGARIGERLRLPYNIGAAHAQIGSSMGFAIYPEHGLTPDILFERADYALYFAKRQRRGDTVLFSADHEAQIRDDHVIEKALQAADLDREFTMVFQPVFDAHTLTVAGFEALARWNSPTLGNVPPNIFIPAAERTGLILNLTKVLLDKALVEAGTWPAAIRLAFNLSAHDLCSSESIIAIIAAVNRSGVSPRRIDFEITETAVARDFSAARAGVDALKVLGAGISLDDFGTGYSSLSHVHRLPLDKLKVDRSFVMDICENPASFKIVKSLTALCGDMGLTCIVEGVETAEQLALLQVLSCDMVQGYHFARPMRPEDIAAYLAIHQPAATPTPTWNTAG